MRPAHLLPLLLLAASPFAAGGACDAECAVSADCGGGGLCVAGLCVDCASDEDCDVERGEQCRDGVCERGGSGEGEGEGGGEGEGEGGGEGEGEGGGEGEGEGEGEGAAEGEGEGEGGGAHGLTATITWDSASGDLDIHLTKLDGASQFCVSSIGSTTTVGPSSSICAAAPLDCNFASCKSTMSTRPQWDATSGNSPGDPHLDVDDLTGYGPETVNVDTLAAGEYLLAVNVYTSASTTLSTNMTAVLHYGGAEVYRSPPVAMSSTSARWSDVAIVVATATSACIEDLLDGNDVDDCPR